MGPGQILSLNSELTAIRTAPKSIERLISTGSVRRETSRPTVSPADQGRPLVLPLSFAYRFLDFRRPSLCLSLCPSSNQSLHDGR